MMSRVALHKLVAPCILYNLDGYYEGLRAQLTHMVKMGLCTPEKLENIHFAADLAEIKTILAKKIMPHQPQRETASMKEFLEKIRKPKTGIPLKRQLAATVGIVSYWGSHSAFCKNGLTQPLPIPSRCCSKGWISGTTLGGLRYGF